MHTSRYTSGHTPKHASKHMSKHRAELEKYGLGKDRTWEQVSTHGCACVRECVCVHHEAITLLQYLHFAGIDLTTLKCAPRYRNYLSSNTTFRPRQAHACVHVCSPARPQACTPACTPARPPARPHAVSPALPPALLHARTRTSACACYVRCHLTEADIIKRKTIPWAPE